MSKALIAAKIDALNLAKNIVTNSDTVDEAEGKLAAEISDYKDLGERQ